MIDPLLQARLRPLLWRLRLRRLAGGLAACWLSVALVGLALMGIHRLTGWRSPMTLPVLGVLALVVVGLLPVILLSRTLRAERRPAEGDLGV